MKVEYKSLKTLRDEQENEHVREDNEFQEEIHTIIGGQKLQIAGTFELDKDSLNDQKVNIRNDFVDMNQQGKMSDQKLSMPDDFLNLQSGGVPAKFTYIAEINLPIETISKDESDYNELFEIVMKELGDVIFFPLNKNLGCIVDEVILRHKSDNLLTVEEILNLVLGMSIEYIQSKVNEALNASETRNGQDTTDNILEIPLDLSLNNNEYTSSSSNDQAESEFYINRHTPSDLNTDQVTETENRIDKTNICIDKVDSKKGFKRCFEIDSDEKNIVHLIEDVKTLKQMKEAKPNVIYKRGISILKRPTVPVSNTIQHPGVKEKDTLQITDGQTSVDPCKTPEIEHSAIMKQDKLTPDAICQAPKSITAPKIDVISQEGDITVNMDIPLYQSTGQVVINNNMNCKAKQSSLIRTFKARNKSVLGGIGKSKLPVTEWAYNKCTKKIEPSLLKGQKVTNIKTICQPTTSSIILQSINGNNIVGPLKVQMVKPICQPVSSTENMNGTNVMTGPTLAPNTIQTRVLGWENINPNMTNPQQATLINNTGNTTNQNVNKPEKKFTSQLKQRMVAEMHNVYKPSHKVMQKIRLQQKLITSATNASTSFTLKEEEMANNENSTVVSTTQELDANKHVRGRIRKAIMESDLHKPSTSGCSKPMHMKRIEQALCLGVLNNNNNEGCSNLSDDDDDLYRFGCGLDEFLKDCEDINEIPIANPDIPDMERSWLTEVLQEESQYESTPSEDINCLVKVHAQQKKISTHASTEMIERHMYYGAGLLSNFDKYPENKKTTHSKAIKRKRDESPKNHCLPDLFQDIQEDLELDFDNGLDVPGILEEDMVMKAIEPAKPSGSMSSRKAKAKKFKDEESKRKWEEMMFQKRRKLFSSMVKKEVGKQQRAKVNRHKEALLQTKKLAMACQKVQRNKALQSARTVKELQWRMKRLSRENLAYWKRSKRVDREIRRKLEKEAEEQRKIDFELVEAKRQQRKLNFLITQTELYAHFMSKKLGEVSPEEQLRILSQLDEEKNPRLASIDDYDSDVMKAKAIKNAHDAFQSEKARTNMFDLEANVATSCDRKLLDTVDGEFSQPMMFKGTLKAYQLRGMNWLANLYDQGISGILADEMGLGKTVQSIAFLSHLAEMQDLWGPFLVICPASTLHNWQQEFAKFVPCFKVVPYWGNPTDRKILRQFWHQDGMHTKDAGFHVVITSYQIVISDVKYFNRIKWQYMVLDEAQAIKSTSSMRWKTLLGFNCRNRLLLSGTPIQNSMAELWALLHFIMPTLFDSHEEFNEWFSKDIESHAENKTGIDEKHLSRLHMILKPFMLRRIKKDVENELSDKIEIMVYCPLTTRQRLLYMALKQKIHIEDLLHYTVGGGDSHSVDKNFTSNLMNLVMQFRKVCNHPELFERRDAKSPIYVLPQSYQIPYLVYDYNVRKEKVGILQKQFLFSKKYITQALTNPESLFKFCLSLGISSQEMYNILQGDSVARWNSYFSMQENLYQNYYKSLWAECSFSLFTKHTFKLSFASVNQSNVLKELLFTWFNTSKRVVYTFTDHIYNSMPETIEHRNIRCKTNPDETEPDEGTKVSNEFHHAARKPQVYTCEKTELPSFLFASMPKVYTQFPNLYCYSRKAAYDYKRHLDDWSWTALNYNWSRSTELELQVKRSKYLHPVLPTGPLDIITPLNGWSNITIPDKETLVTDSGKLFVLDTLLKRLKEEGHRVLIYSQMTKMIDLLEEYMWHRHHKYMRLDGSSKISERRDMVADFQARTDIFVFLLSTRAGGLGINLTAADTVIFYDSDWNPTVDQQAMDRAHRLGQTKQVTVYRLICKGSIEERILQRAREKSEIQNLVISGGNFKPETLKPKEVVSLLLDDEEIELKYRQRAEERKAVEDMREMDRKRKYANSFKNAQANVANESKKPKTDSQESGFEEQWQSVDSVMSSPHSENSADILTTSDDLTDGSMLDIDTWDTSNKMGMYNAYAPGMKGRNVPRGSSKRGRPRGSRRISALGRFNANPIATPLHGNEAAHSEATSSTSYVPFETPVTSVQGTSSSILTSPTSYSGSSTARRGPGRPRLKPGGPANTGSRGTYRPRKPAKPLPVPLPSDGSVTPGTSYSYFQDHSDT